MIQAQKNAEEQLEAVERELERAKYEAANYRTKHSVLETALVTAQASVSAP